MLNWVAIDRGKSMSSIDRGKSMSSIDRGKSMSRLQVRISKVGNQGKDFMTTWLNRGFVCEQHGVALCSIMYVCHGWGPFKGIPSALERIVTMGTMGWLSCFVVSWNVLVVNHA